MASAFLSSPSLSFDSNQIFSTNRILKKSSFSGIAVLYFS